ncbi:protein LONGIFOLIA 1 isoform X2 [Cajanus cajan]|uniref:protein LONGIFOLIA 1 isoform X2 n=1 Tax=Cajanus cajan TaxID=3821 RepID=UPI00098D91AD|nr:protein LONGIFOLIA 1 isoform X2 [Cajanus cajan]
MATKLLHSLADDNPDLQKQIGCMSGVFQLFDRHQIVPARRISPKRLPSGISHLNYDSLERGSNDVHQRQSASDKRGVSEKQRISTESSRTSFSSSCSSSMSSLDNKAQADAPFDRIVYPKSPMRYPVMNQTSTSSHLGSHSLDLRDVVKDSMYREARGLSKERDSPRHFPLSKSVEGKQNTPIDLKETLQVLAKLREAPRHYVEAKELPRLSSEVKDGQWHSISKDAPRFSYDGKETRGISFESQCTIKCSPKLKELPRLSLDGREGSWHTHISDSKPSYLSRNFNVGGASTSVDNISSPQHPSASQGRPPSVVAKLMGLEALPESYIASDTMSSLSSENGSTQSNDQFMKNGLFRPLGASNSPKISLKDTTSPRWKNPDLAGKPILSSRLPIEPAPWKQQDGNQSSERLTSRAIKATARTPDSFPSVYSEIEKRLSDLEFKQSGRDLRALKRILEAMQVKGLLETRKEEQASNVGNKRDFELKPSPIQHSISSRQQTISGSASARALESPIVIMKPARLIEKTGISDSSVFPIGGLSNSHKLQSGALHAHDKKESTSGQIAKDQSLKTSYRDASTSFSERKENSIKTTKSAQSQQRSKQFPKENGSSSVRNSGSVSPIMQQKKMESEKKSCLPSSPSDSNKSRRQSYKQTTESRSPSRKLRPKVHNPQYSDDQLSETSNELRSLSCQWDEISLQSDTITVDSKMDIEVTSSLQSAEIIDSHSPSMKAIEHLVSGSMQTKSTMRWDGYESIAELATDAPDHPSLDSVLDDSVYKYDMSSLVNRTSNAPKDQWNHADGFFIINTRYREINRKKLQSIDRLIQKLRQLNSSHDETRIDYIASLCENTNPDHRYIAEILLASGLLLRAMSSELLTFQNYSSVLPINPELFLVLEQIKLSSFLSKEETSLGKVACMKLNTEKWHRKLIFDAVNEILGEKLGSFLEPWLKHNGLATKFVSAQKLLKELCFEIQKLQPLKADCCLEDEGDGLKSMLWEDVMRHSVRWTDFPSELPGVVLDVERLIFKDLVDEFLIDEVASLRVK